MGNAGQLGRGIMKHKNSHLLVGYWSRQRNGRDVPDQTDIDPRAIKRMLPCVFILDVGMPSRPVYRLAGTALCERYGFELKGTGFLSHWEPQSASALTALLRQSLALRQPVCVTAIGASAEHGMVEFESVLAPVTFNGGEPTRFVGLSQILSDQTVLAGKPIAFQRLAGSQFIHEDQPLPSFDNLPPPPPPPTGLRALRSHPKAPHLRLVVSQSKPTVHFVDESAQTMIEALDSSLARLNPA
jgi:hypothetical protein